MGTMFRVVVAGLVVTNATVEVVEAVKDSDEVTVDTDALESDVEGDRESESRETNLEEANPEVVDED